MSAICVSPDDSIVGRLIKIGVWEYDQWVFAAKLEYNFFQAHRATFAISVFVISVNGPSQP